MVDLLIRIKLEEAIPSVTAAQISNYQVLIMTNLILHGMEPGIRAVKSAASGKWREFLATRLEIIELSGIKYLGEGIRLKCVNIERYNALMPEISFSQFHLQLLG